MNKTYHFTTNSNREAILNIQYSGIGYAYPRIFAVAPLSKWGFINLDLTMGCCFNMRRDAWNSWFDDTIIELSDEAAIRTVCENHSLNYNEVMKWLDEAVLASYTLDSFMASCMACGGNLTQMLLAGIKACWPTIYDAMPDWDFTYDDVMFMVQSLCSDQDTTFCGVHVNKHLSMRAPTHVIEVRDEKFVFTLLDKAPAMSCTDWYIQECGVEPEDIEAFKAQMRRG